MARIEVTAELGEEIVTRQHGMKLRTLVEQALARGDTVAVDFGDLQVTSVSFFDEAFGQIAHQIGHERFADRIRFENIDPFDLALVNDIVLSRSGESARKNRKVTRLRSKGLSGRKRPAAAG